ncbi:MAG: hypothetical protein KDB53_07295 [Planctomycetes bacterium]|nr:hypothetical protein [Planctomycetota bacterium]
MKTRITLAVALVFAVAIPLTAQVPVGSGSPYFEDFEGGPGAWVASGGLWEHGIPDPILQPGIPAAFSGLNCFMTDLDANYPNNASTTIEASFDCSTLPYDPILSFQLRTQSETFFDGVSVLIDTGSGFVTLGTTGEPNWYTNGNRFDGANANYIARSHTLDGGAGNIVTIQITFTSDSSVIIGAGAAIDDIAIALGPIPPTVLTMGTPYTEDFEGGPGNWYAQAGVGSIWEFGTPTGSTINAAASGSNAWGVDLAGGYLDDTVAILETAFDATALAHDPVFSFSIHYDSEFDWDGTFVEIDTGAGYQIVGAQGQGMNWYNNFLLSFSTDAFSGSSNGYVTASIPLAGVAGQQFGLRVVFLADNINAFGDGVAIDDISVGVVPPPYPGTMEDLTLDSSVNFGPLTGGDGATDVKSVVPLDFITLFMESAGGTFDLLPYALVATLFDGTVAPVPSPMLGAYADSNSTVVLGLGASDFALGFSAIMPPSGVGVTFEVPPAFAGVDVLMQAFSITTTGATNMFYASSNGQVIDG